MFKPVRNDTDFKDMYSSGDMYAVGDIYGDSTEFYEEYMDSYNDTKKTGQIIIRGKSTFKIREAPIKKNVLRPLRLYPPPPYRAEWQV